MIGKRKLKPIVLLGVTALVITAISNACGQFMSSDSNDGALSDLNICKTAEPLPPEPGTKTVGIVYGSGVLENMVMCTGLGYEAMSAETQQAYIDRSGSFSQYGDAKDVNSAMMMGIAALAVEVCADVVEKEMAMPMGNPPDLASAYLYRKIFNTYDFSSNSANDSAITDSAIRMARSCWGRDMLDEERTEIVNGINEMGVSEATSKAIAVCTSVLSSLTGIAR